MVPIERILCPVDFSDFSRHAFDHALALAQGHGATVTALNVVPIAVSTSILPYVEPASLGPFELPPGERTRVFAALQQFLAVDHTFDGAVSLEASEAPDVAQEILAQAGRLPADLIVMGTHGRSGFERLVLGSVTEKVLRKAQAPVLTVPRAAPSDPLAARRPFERILCAMDFSDCAMSAFGYARSLAEESSGRLGVLHVVELALPAYDPLIGPAIDLPGYRQACEIAGRERLHKVIAADVRTSLGVDEVIASGKPHHEILRIAREWARTSSSSACTGETSSTGCSSARRSSP